ncbi:cation diffusion facilitator family transporter [Shimia aestuarii]|uniref:Cation diffusion facilitator family transporter n=1 Tax=Shimia aestuarii TaxID=254406 RepID=A0A1I4R4D6_9RHOB|nr:cation diffusion facilitator family transporter [Shimia aestuarii]SFM47119.1 cation diffusion facilitator family transporter [Shimia aestuarii]
MSHKFALWSIPVAVAVFLLKLLAWHWTGSVALLSDALESIVNVVAAMIAFYAVQLSAKPADDKHPFGHSKAEYLSAVAEGAMILLAALLVMREAIGALPDPSLKDAPMAGIVVNMVAAGINAAWAMTLMRVGRANRSPALVASARHILTDVFTSVGVVVGLGLALATGWMILDPILAILVALNILREGWKVLSESVDGLMDASVNDGELQAIEAAVSGASEGALQVHDLRARRSASIVFVEMHLVVPKTMSVGAAHDICDRIEAAVKEVLPVARTTVHVEPESELI